MSRIAKFGFLSSIGRCLMIAVGSILPAVGMEVKDVQWGGAGWFSYGIIGHSSDTLRGQDLNGRGLLNSGAQISVSAKVSENLQIEAGVGANAGHFVAGSSQLQGGYAPMNVAPFVSNANFNYSFWKEEGSGLSLRGGLFPYDYAPDAQNLGLYLLRGPVYPGYLISGFETKHVLPVANTLGAQLRHQYGALTHDILLTVETEFYPYYDISPAYVASVQAGPAIRIGAGINLYHLLPIHPKLTDDSVWFFVDTTGSVPETTQIAFSGTKVSAFFSFDPKVPFGEPQILGEEDFKIYGEVALNGLDNSTPYKETYGDYIHRMPVMLGINLPAFKVLDRLALEVEWYGAKFRDNPKRFEHTAGNEPSPFPYVDIQNPDPNVAEDNWKWSLYGSRIIQKHLKVSLQVANDHFRPGIFTGYGDNAPPRAQAVTNTSRDWYFMSKIAYFF